MAELTMNQEKLNGCIDLKVNIMAVQREVMQLIQTCQELRLPATAARLDDAVQNMLEAINFTNEATKMLKQRMVAKGEKFDAA